MKKYFLLALLFWMTYDAYAQNTFEKVIDTLGSSFANCVQQTLDGGYILCGGSNLGGNDAVVVKLDSIGTIEWAKTYSGPSIEGALRIYQLPDSSYIMDGVYNNGATQQNHRHWLLRLNANGDTLWTKSFTAGAGGVEANCMAVNHNGHYGLTGYFNPINPTHPDVYIMIADSTGNLVASKIYSSTFGSQGLAINKSNSNGYIITGAKATSVGSTDIIFLLVDSIGDTLRYKTFNYSQTDVGMAVEQTSDDGFILAGFTWPNTTGKENIYIIKTNYIGDTLWTKAYNSSVIAIANSIEQTTDGGYIITGLTGAGIAGSGDLYLVKTDSTGDTLWTRKYGGNNQDIGYYVRQTIDGGYIITGSTSQANGGIYLIKTDSLGKVSSPLSFPEIKNPIDVMLFPNPSWGKFNLRVSGLTNSNYTYEICTTLGRKLLTGKLNKPINQISETEIDLKQYPEKMYYIIITDKKSRIVKKALINR